MYEISIEHLYTISTKVMPSFINCSTAGEADYKRSYGKKRSRITLVQCTDSMHNEKQSYQIRWI